MTPITAVPIPVVEVLVCQSGFLPAGRILGVCHVHCCGRTGYHVGCYGLCTTQEIAFHTEGTPSALSHRL